LWNYQLDSGLPLWLDLRGDAIHVDTGRLRFVDDFVPHKLDNSI
jgi:hypothetical protein